MFSFLKKRDYVASIEPAGQRLTVRGGEKLLTAALEAGLDWPHDCRVGSCGTCRCTLKDGRIKALTDFVYTLDPDDIQAGAILACQTLLKSDVVVEVELGDGSARAARVAGGIAATRYLTHDIQQVEVRLDGAGLEHVKAGQYADITAAGLDAPRSYSFARAPGAEREAHATFFIRHVPGGEFTDWLFGADRTGEAVQLAGPYGAFGQQPGNGRMICIAGGSGLAPIHALVEDGALAGLARDCVVLFGARAQRDLYCLEELAALGRRWNGAFEVVPVLSDEPADSDWPGSRGLVTDVLAKLVGERGFVTEEQAYLCGPPPMVDAGIAGLQGLGMHESAIFYDKFLDASSQPGGRGGLRA